MYIQKAQYLAFTDQIRISLVLELARDRTDVRRDEVNEREDITMQAASPA